jgi:hypothetical protein
MNLGLRTCVLALALLAVTAFGGGSAYGANPKALILGSTVSPCSATTGCPQSLEEQQAIADGFDVTVASDAAWTAMTEASSGATRC